MESKILLRTQNLTKDFGRRGSSFSAVKEVNLELEDKKFYHLVGRSGSGKSTLLKLLAALTRPTSGSIEFLAKNYDELTEDELSELRLSSIGFVSQSRLLLGNLNVHDNIRLPYDMLNKSGDPEPRIKELLERFGLSHIAEDYTQTLSGGEAKRVQLARALMNQPALLLCDEPTADLDTETTKEVMQLLKEVSSECTVLVVTHELDLLHYSEECWTMRDGSLEAGCKL